MNLRLLLFLALLAPLATADGKPPGPARNAPHAASTPPAAADQSGASFLRWVLLQNGGPGAVAIPWPEIVRAAGGRTVSPLDPASPPDAAMLAKLGSVLDAALPRLNRPDGPLRAAPPVTSAETVARIADELRATLAALPGHTAEVAAVPGEAACPLLRWSEGAGGRTCYLAVAVYPAGGKDAALRTLTVRATDLAGQITTDGACLLVGIEGNGKPGRDLALLNWEIVDLARVSLRCAVTFEGDADTLHAPGATLGDGRRGRD